MITPIKTKLVPTVNDSNTKVELSKSQITKTATEGAPLGSYRIIGTNFSRSCFPLLRKLRTETDKKGHFNICLGFYDYLTNSNSLNFKISGQRLQVDGSSAGLTEKRIPYIHRWTPVYRNSILSKFYQLEEYLKENPTPLTMLTLTTYQAGNYSVEKKGHAVDIEESFKIINEGFRKLRHIVTKRVRPGVPYVWVLEPHTKHNTGYPHIHVIFFTEFTDNEKERITNLWAEKYQAGSAEHGVDFAFKPPGESVKSIRNYLMKYMASTFLDTGSKYGTEGWTTGILLFNALVWHHGYRMWGASRDLSKVMARDISDEIENIEWYENMLMRNEEEEIGQVWKLSDSELQEVQKRFNEYIKRLPELL